MAIRFESILFKKYGNVWDIAVHVPQSEALKLKGLTDKRVLCTINDKKTIHAALMSQGNGDFFINQNKEVPKNLNLDLGDQVNISLEKDTSKYGMPLPEELKTAWDLDEDGYKVFHTLTMGKQRSLVHIIGKPKSSEIRIRKALIILEYLKSVNGQLDYKELNEAFKAGKNV